MKALLVITNGLDVNAYSLVGSTIEDAIINGALGLTKGLAKDSLIPSVLTPFTLTGREFFQFIDETVRMPQPHLDYAKLATILRDVTREERDEIISQFCTILSTECDEDDNHERMGEMYLCAHKILRRKQANILNPHSWWLTNIFRFETWNNGQLDRFEDACSDGDEVIWSFFDIEDATTPYLQISF